MTRAKDIVLDALMMAVWRRKPVNCVIVNSDKDLNMVVMIGFDSVAPITWSQA